MPSLTTQAGEVAAVKSWLLASDIQDSTLRSPGLPITESSTAKAPPAASARAGSNMTPATSTIGASACQRESILMIIVPSAPHRSRESLLDRNHQTIVAAVLQVRTNFELEQIKIGSLQN